MGLKKIWHRARRMCRAAYITMKVAVILSCLSFAAALVFCIISGGLTVETYNYYYTARELANLPFGILLLGIIASVCIEDFSERKSR
jgi:hypothetical protein